MVYKRFCKWLFWTMMLVGLVCMTAKYGLGAGFLAYVTGAFFAAALVLTIDLQEADENVDCKE